MCDICRRVPCHPRCPNATDPVPIFTCYVCQNEIYEGEDVYHLVGLHFCERCINESREEAVPEYDEDFRLDL
jgi:hypothetical protein